MGTSGQVVAMGVSLEPGGQSQVVAWRKEVEKRGVSDAARHGEVEVKCEESPGDRWGSSGTRAGGLGVNGTRPLTILEPWKDEQWCEWTGEVLAGTPQLQKWVSGEVGGEEVLRGAGVLWARRTWRLYSATSSSPPGTADPQPGYKVSCHRAQSIQAARQGQVIRRCSPDLQAPWLTTENLMTLLYVG